MCVSDTSRMVLCVSLSRLSRQLAATHESAIAGIAAMSFGAEISFPNQFSVNRWSVMEAAVGGPLKLLSPQAKNRIIAAQAFCATAALELSPQLPMVWKNFGDILISIMKVLCCPNTAHLHMALPNGRHT